MEKGESADGLECVEVDGENEHLAAFVRREITAIEEGVRRTETGEREWEKGGEPRRKHGQRKGRECGDRRERRGKGATGLRRSRMRDGGYGLGFFSCCCSEVFT